MRDEAQAGMRRGRRQPAKTIAVAGLATTGSLAGFLVVLTVFLATSVLAVMARGIARIWRRLGLYGRLMTGMVLSWPVADLMRLAGLIPARWHVLSLGLGAAGSAVCALALYGLKARGQRRWRGRRGTVVPGSLGAHILSNAERVDEIEALTMAHQAEMAELRQAVAMLTRTLAAIGTAAGVDMPELAREPRRLHLVEDVAGTAPRVSSL